MKVASSQLQSFLKQDFLKYKGVFLFGNNRGLILNRSKFLQNRFIESKNQEVSKIQLEYEAVAKNPSLLYTEINSLSLFAKDKIIVVNNVANNISKPLSDVVESDTVGCFIVFQGYDIISASSTKKYFDSHKNFASLACYNLTSEEIKNHISHILSKKGVKLESPELLSFISDQLGGDYDVLLSELDKLALLAHSKGELTFDNVKSVLISSKSVEYNDIIQHLVKEDFSRFSKDFENLISASDGGVIGIIRNLLNHFIKLLKVKTLISQGKPQEEAMSALGVQIFYKYEQDFKLALKKYSPHELTSIIESLINLEIDCKSKSIDHRILLQQWVLALLIKTQKSKQ